MCFGREIQIEYFATKIDIEVVTHARNLTTPDKKRSDAAPKPASAAKRDGAGSLKTHQFCDWLRGQIIARRAHHIGDPEMRDASRKMRMPGCDPGFGIRGEFFNLSQQLIGIADRDAAGKVVFALVAEHSAVVEIRRES